jgi:hypothetical protein
MAHKWSGYANKLIPCLAALYLVAVCQMALGQDNNAQAVTSTPTFPYGEYAEFALKIGTGCTVLFGTLKAFSEWSAPGRKKRAMEEAVRLANFVDAVSRIPDLDGSGAELREANERAQKELAEATAGCYRTGTPPSRVRRIFLLYLPTRWSAYVPHILFFTLCALLGDGIYAAFTDNSQDMTKGEWCWVFFLIGCLLLLMQRWAALERRRENGEILAPTRLMFGLHWYHANSFLGFASNSWLVFNAIGLLLMPWTYSTMSTVQSTFLDAWPNWQRIVMAIINAPALPIAYFWSRSEFLIASGAIRPLKLREIVRRSSHFRFPERPICASVLFLLTIWCFVLVLDTRNIGRMAAFPDGSVGTTGLSSAWFGLVFVFLLVGAVPWIAVYRGLPTAFNDLDFPSEGGQNAAE